MAVAAALISAGACARNDRPDRPAAKIADSAVAATGGTVAPASTSTTVDASLAVPADTVRGVVSVFGNAPVTSVLLSFGADTAPLALVGEPSVRKLRAIAGVEVMVTGRRTMEIDRAASPRGAVVFRVERFVVRAVDGIPAEDGELVSSSGGFALRRADGKELKISALPPALRTRVGARIYLAGPLDRGPAAYGVIDR